MADSRHLQAGDTIVFDNRKAVVLNAGKARISYSIQVLYQGEPENKPTLITEVDFWMKIGKIKWLNRRGKNVAWARTWRQNHPSLLLDL